jgi:hypothetical protein
MGIIQNMKRNKYNQAHKEKGQKSHDHLNRCRKILCKIQHWEGSNFLFAGKCMELQNIVLSEISQVKKDKGHIFSHMWKIDPNANTRVIIYTYTYTYTYTYIYTQKTHLQKWDS